ncbi:hypothetical protein [Aeromonas media]|nr:hypothetical protein [Aeromonas media]AHX62719.1 hypothetical protein B224_4792 [Aeromonas media WS]QQQ13983.1 hypothetical protein JJL53_01995 [Aeromonas media]
MSIANDLNDVVEASGDMLARLAIFADHIPDEWITAAAAVIPPKNQGAHK